MPANGDIVMSRVESAAAQRRSACQHQLFKPRLETRTSEDETVQPVQAEKVEEIPRQ